jgi:exonuclease I
MVGIPGEIDADVEATIQMFRDIKKAAPRLRLTYGCR